MAFGSFRPLLRNFAFGAALAAAFVGGAGPAPAAQIRGADQLSDALPHSRALGVLRQMQRDSVKVDSRHWQAAQRCDRAAMEQYQRQLDGLAAQARNVIRNSGLENDTSSNALDADRIAANIEMRARHAASRQAQNCGGASQEPTGTTGTTGGSNRGPSAEPMRELEKESIRLNSLHYEAAQRCDRAAMEQYLRQLDAVVDQAGQIMRNAAMGPRGVKSAVFRNAERSAHNIARRADEARKREAKNCPEETRQRSDGTGSTSTTGSPPQQPAPPPAEPLPEQSGETPRSAAPSLFDRTLSPAREAAPPPAEERPATPQQPVGSTGVSVDSAKQTGAKPERSATSKARPERRCSKAQAEAGDCQRPQ